MSLLLNFKTYQEKLKDMEKYGKACEDFREEIILAEHRGTYDFSTIEEDELEDFKEHSYGFQDALDFLLGNQPLMQKRLESACRTLRSARPNPFAGE